MSFPSNGHRWNGQETPSLTPPTFRRARALYAGTGSPNTGNGWQSSRQTRQKRSKRVRGVNELPQTSQRNRGAERMRRMDRMVGCSSFRNMTYRATRVPGKRPGFGSALAGHHLIRPAFLKLMHMPLRSDQLFSAQTHQRGTHVRGDVRAGAGSAGGSSSSAFVALSAGPPSAVPTRADAKALRAS